MRNYDIHIMCSYNQGMYIMQQSWQPARQAWGLETYIVNISAIIDQS